MKVLRAAVLLALASEVGGCSFMFVDRPRRRPPEDEPRSAERFVECTSGRGLPIADTVIAGLAGLLTLSAATETGSNRETQAIVDLGLVTSGFVASAIYGFLQTGTCRELKREVEPPPPRVRGSRPVPPGYDPWLAPPAPLPAPAPLAAPARPTEEVDDEEPPADPPAP